MHQGITTVIEGTGNFDTLELGRIECSCHASSDGTKPLTVADDQPPCKALSLQEIDAGSGRQSRPWWDFMNDPDHPSRRTSRPRRTDELSCGPLGGAMSLYWYWIGCPSPSDARPKTPTFFN